MTLYRALLDGNAEYVKLQYFRWGFWWDYKTYRGSFDGGYWETIYFTSLPEAKNHLKLWGDQRLKERKAKQWRLVEIFRQ